MFTFIRVRNDAKFASSVLVVGVKHTEVLGCSKCSDSCLSSSRCRKYLEAESISPRLKFDSELLNKFLRGDRHY